MTREELSQVLRFGLNNGLENESFDAVCDLYLELQADLRKSGNDADLSTVNLFDSVAPSINLFINPLTQ